MKPVWVIANPKAAGGGGARVIPELEKALNRSGIDFSVHRTAAPGHARGLAHAARSVASRILVVGGDGTVHEVANGLLADPEPSVEGLGLPPLVILPVGTGNDFFRMVRSPRGIPEAVHTLRLGVPRSFEVGEARWEGGQRHFVNLVGVGIDVEVLRRRSTFGRLPGLLQYLGALGAALTCYRPIPLRVTLYCSGQEPRVLEAPVMLSAVTVGPSVGGGFLLSPKAVPDDGFLDLFHVRKLGLLKVVRYLPSILRGAGLERPEISQLQGTRFHIQRMDDRALAFELDGELMETSTPFLEIRVRPESLEILELPEKRG